MTRPISSAFVLLLLSFAFLAACGTEPPDSLDEIPVSIDPAELESGETAIVGRILDFETNQPIPDAIVSTSPASEIVRTTSRGEFVLRTDLQLGELYRVLAEAEGYQEQYAMVRAVENRRNVDMTLISTDRSLPVVFEPFAGVFAPSEHRTDATMFSRADDELQWEIADMPDWITVEPTSGTLATFDTQRLRLSIVPEEFQDRVGTDPYMEGRIRVRDERDRFAIYNFIAIPAGPSQVEIEIEHDDQVDVGDTLSVAARVLYDGAGFVGATISLDVTGPAQGLVPTTPRIVAGANGRVTIELEAHTAGDYELSFALPAISGITPVVTTVEVVGLDEDDPCATDNGGCGDYAACTVDAEGGVVCEDLSFCDADDEGENYCGVADYWDCQDQPLEAPICTDLLFCETDDHSCDLTQEHCVDQVGGPYVCEPIDFPEVESLNGPPELTNQTGATLVFGCSKSSCTFDCQLSGAATGPVAVTNPCTSPVVVEGLSDDEYSFAVTATDSEGVTGPEATWSWTVDTVEPTVSLTDVPPAVSESTTAEFGFTCSKDECTFECEITRTGPGDPTTTMPYTLCESGDEFPFLGDGHYQFAVRATDPAGNQGPQTTYQWQVSTELPSITSLSMPPTRTGDRDMSFDFECDDSEGCTFVCTLTEANSSSGQGPAPCSSPMEYSNLPDGTYTFEVYAVVGTLEGPPAQRLWTIDNAAPDVVDLTGPAARTSDRDATFGFACSKEICTFDCALYHDGTQVSSSSGCESGETFPGLADGTYSFEVWAIDDLGNQGDPVAWNWLIDNEPPVVTVTDSPGATVAVGDAEFTFECDKDDCTFECELSGPVDQGPESCTSPFSYEELAGGDYTFGVWATDDLGNLGEPTEVSWTVDLSAPTVTITDGPGQATSDSEVSLAFECSKSACDFQCALDGPTPSVEAPCTSPTTFEDLADGDYIFTVQATDEGGQTGPTATLEWIVDSVVPEIEFLVFPPPLTSDAEADFAFWCSNKTCTFECALDVVDTEGQEHLGDWEACVSPMTQTLSIPGAQTFRLRATDTVGLIAQESYEFTYFEPAWAQVATGGSHTCAVTAVNDLYCWGSNGGPSVGGQLGQGDAELRREPASVDPPGVWESVQAGGDHTCALRTDGTLWCWGNNSSGRFGNGSTGFINRWPVQSGEDDDWAQITISGSHSCGIRDDGTLWCWGNGSNGRLGLDDGNQSHTTPQQVGEDDDWVDIAVGGGNTCGIRAEGTLWCWGLGQNGATANGSATSGPDVPTEVSVSMNGWLSVSMGSHHGCGVLQNPVDGRKLFCWGRNNYGQTGHDTSTNQTTPVEVVGDQIWVDVVAFSNTTCGLTVDGEIWCWGDLSYGQSGNEDPPANSSLPTLVATDVSWRQLDVGANHVCAVDDEDDLFCWGRDFTGQIGTGNPAGAGFAHREVAFVDEVVSVSAGRNYGCLIADDASLWCWGDNLAMQLGLGDPFYRPFPYRVGEAATWAQVSSSSREGTFGRYTHTCGVQDDSSLWCWGSGNAGKLGVGDTNSRSEPAQVFLDGDDGPGDWTWVTTGSSHTCGLRDGGELYCWGSNGSGALGMGSVGTQNTPTRVGEDLWLAVEAGQGRTCGIRADQTLWCWGRDLGGSTDEEPMLAIAEGESDWEFLAGHYGHYCAIKTDGTLWCWGATGFGRLGDSSDAGATTPGEVSLLGDGTAWIYATTGEQHSCGIQNDNTAWCWGSNGAGRLGISSSSTSTPQQLPGDDWAELAAGAAHTTGIRIESDGRRTAFSWGDNGFGERGDGLSMQVVPFLLDRY